MTTYTTDDGRRVPGIELYGMLKTPDAGWSVVTVDDGVWTVEDQRGDQITLRPDDV